jgi:transcriptional regulator with XRE-family HTH domain
VGRRLRRRWLAARTRRGGLGERVGVDYATINPWQVGRLDPGVRHLQAIGGALGVAPDEFCREAVEERDRALDTDQRRGD